MTPSQERRHFQTAADDLATVERFLVQMYHSVNATLFPMPTVAVLRVARQPKLRKPDAPRCNQWSVNKNAPCNQPAERPNGMCASHFSRVGHCYGGNYSFHNDYGTYTCRKCGRSWRYETCNTPASMTEEIKDEQRVALNEICPARNAR